MIKIDEELKALIPPLTEEEYNQLEQNILKEGIREPIIVWPVDFNDGDYYEEFIVDGHNRHSIALKHNLNYNVSQKEFESREEVIEWMILNQFGRRNLSAYQRSLLALKLKPVFEEKAKEKKIESGGAVPQKSAKPSIDTRQELAKVANVSHDTIAKVQKIEDKAPTSLKEKISTGDISINKGHEIVKKLQFVPVEDVDEFVEKRIQEIEDKKKIAKQKKEEEARAKKEARIRQLEANSIEYEENEKIKIIHGDCIDELKKIPDNSINLILIDPPYFEVVKDSWDNDWKNIDEYLKWSRQWMEESLRILREDGSFYIWGSVGEKSDAIIRQKLLLDELGLKFKDWITWKKRRGLGNRRGWLYTREECLWYVKNNDLFIWNDKEQYTDEENQFKAGFGGHEVKSEFKRITNVWTDIPEQLANKNIIHNTPKPEKAIERIINLHTKENDTVLDFFGGSGTTAIVSKRTNRNCIIIEKDEKSIVEIRGRLNETI